MKDEWTRLWVAWAHAAGQLPEDVPSYHKRPWKTRHAGMRKLPTRCYDDVACRWLMLTLACSVEFFRLRFRFTCSLDKATGIYRIYEPWMLGLGTLSHCQSVSLLLCHVYSDDAFCG